MSSFQCFPFRGCHFAIDLNCFADTNILASVQSNLHLIVFSISGSVPHVRSKVFSMNPMVLRSFALCFPMFGSASGCEVLRRQTL